MIFSRIYFNFPASECKRYAHHITEHTHIYTSSNSSTRKYILIFLFLFRLLRCRCYFSFAFLPKRFMLYIGLTTRWTWCSFGAVAIDDARFSSSCIIILWTLTYFSACETVLRCTVERDNLIRTHERDVCAKKERIRDSCAGGVLYALYSRIWN